MLRIRPVAAFEDFDHAPIGMVAECFQSRAASRLLGAFVRDQGHRMIETDGENISRILEVGVGLAVLNIGSETAEIRQDRLAIFRVFADFAWQQEQFDGAVECDVLRIFLFGFRERGAFRLVVRGHLDIGAKATIFQIYHLTRLGVQAEFVSIRIDRGRRIAICAELAREFAFRVTGASDECAIAAELHGQLTLLAQGALARVFNRVSVSVLAREHICAEFFVQHIQNG